MGGFNPDAYLAEPPVDSAKDVSFDPDAYLGDTPIPETTLDSQTLEATKPPRNLDFITAATSEAIENNGSLRTQKNLNVYFDTLKKIGYTEADVNTIRVKLGYKYERSGSSFDNIGGFISGDFNIQKSIPESSDNVFKNTKTKIDRQPDENWLRNAKTDPNDSGTATVVKPNTQGQPKDYYAPLANEIGHQKYSPVERSIILKTADTFSKNPLYKKNVFEGETNPRDTYFDSLEKQGIQNIDVLKQGVYDELAHRKHNVINEIASAPIEAVIGGVQSLGEMAPTAENIATTVVEGASKGEGKAEIVMDLALKPIGKAVDAVFGLAGATPHGAAFYSGLKAIEEMSPDIAKGIGTAMMPLSNLAVDENSEEYKKALAKVGDAAIMVGLGMLGVHGKAYLKNKTPFDLGKEAAEKVNQMTHEQQAEMSDTRHIPENIVPTLNKIEIENELKNTDENSPVYTALATKLDELKKGISDMEHEIAISNAEIDSRDAGKEFIVQTKEKLIASKEGKPESVKQAIDEHIAKLDEQLGLVSDPSEYGKLKSESENILSKPNIGSKDLIRLSDIDTQMEGIDNSVNNANPELASKIESVKSRITDANKIIDGGGSGIELQKASEESSKAAQELIPLLKEKNRLLNQANGAMVHDEHKTPENNALGELNKQDEIPSEPTITEDTPVVPVKEPDSKPKVEGTNSAPAGEEGRVNKSEPTPEPPDSGTKPPPNEVGNTGGEKAVVEKSKSGYYVATEDGIIPMHEAKPMANPYGFDLFTHESGDVTIISEGITGVELAEGKNRGEAQKVLFDKINNKGLDVVRKAIADREKSGITPRGEKIRAEENKAREEVKEKLKKETKDLSKQVNEIIRPDESKPKKEAKRIIQKNVIGVTDLTKGINKLQDPLRIVKEKTEDALTRVFERGVTNENKAIRIATKAITNWWGGLLRNRDDIRQFLSLKGMTKEFAPEEATALQKNLSRIVDNDPDALKRVHSALDPDIYEAKDRVKFDDLTDPEKALYEKIKQVNSLIHDWNFANGLLDLETYNKYKDKYIGRLYENIEIPEDVAEVFSHGNAGGSKLNLNIFKARGEIDQWRIDNKVSDPAYITAKRMMQTIQNDAVLTYIDYLIKNKSNLISDVAKPGFTEMGHSKIYGDLRGKFVANHLAEDFKGYFYSNALTNTLYDAFKAYNRNEIVQFYKKYNTLYSPTVQLGNALGNGVFAFFAGIDPVTFSSKIPEAVKQIKNRGEDYIDLVKNGLIGRTGLTDDFLPLVQNKTRLNATTASQKGLINTAKNVLGKADELASTTYQGADNIAKLAAYLSLKDMGYSTKKAMDMTYDGFQNYATVGKTWDLAAKTPVFGNPFVKFQADLQRILKNLVTTRPLQAVAFVTLLKTLASQFSQWSGETPEEKKIRENRKGIPKIQLPEFLGGNVPVVWKIGGSEVNAARFISPIYSYDVGQSDGTLQEISRFLPYQFVNVKQNELGEESTSLAFGDPVGGTIASVMFDRDFRGKSIKNPDANRYYNPSPTQTERLINQFQYLSRSMVPFYKNINDFKRSWDGEEDYYGRQRTWKEAILNNIIKVQSFGKPEVQKAVTSEIDYLTKNFVFQSQRMGDANNDAYKKIKVLDERLKNKSITKDQYNSLYQKTIDTRNNRLVEETKKQIDIQKKLEESVSLYTRLYGQGDVQEEYLKEVTSARAKALRINQSKIPIDLKTKPQSSPVEIIENETDVEIIENENTE